MTKGNAIIPLKRQYPHYFMLKMNFFLCNMYSAFAFVLVTDFVAGFESDCLIQIVLNVLCTVFGKRSCFSLSNFCIHNHKPDIVASAFYE
jgi:hypothetical protein